MVTSTRLRFLLLALMVAASHVALVSHVTAHFQPALEQCELCVSQAQPLAAIPAAESEPCAKVASATSHFPAAPQPILASAAHPWFQRAPPVTSS
jgi:hypothetical protein